MNWPYKICKTCPDTVDPTTAYSCGGTNNRDAKWCLGQGNLLKDNPESPTKWYYTHKPASGADYKACTSDCKTIANWKEGDNQLGGYTTTKGASDKTGDYVKYTINPATKVYAENPVYVGDPWCEKCTAKCTDCSVKGDGTACDVGKCWTSHF